MPTIEIHLLTLPSGETITVDTLDNEVASLGDLKSEIKRRTGLEPDEIEIRRYDNGEALIDSSSDDDDGNDGGATASANTAHKHRHRTLRDRGISPAEEHQTSVKLQMTPHPKDESDRRIERMNRQHRNELRAMEARLAAVFAKQLAVQSEMFSSKINDLQKEVVGLGQTVAAVKKELSAVPKIDAAQWNTLGKALAKKTDTVTVNGTVFTRKECYLNCLRRDPEHGRAWNELGTDLDDGENIDVNGTPITKFKCYLNAVTFHPQGGSAVRWTNLGKAVPLGESVTVFSTPHTKRDCFLKALASSPKYGSAWKHLADLLAPDETIQVNGVSTTKEQCVANAQLYKKA